MTARELPPEEELELEVMLRLWLVDRVATRQQSEAVMQPWLRELDLQRLRSVFQ